MTDRLYEVRWRARGVTGRVIVTAPNKPKAKATARRLAASPIVHITSVERMPDTDRSKP